MPDSKSRIAPLLRGIAATVVVAGAAIMPAASAHAAARQSASPVTAGMPCVPSIEGPVQATAASRPYQPVLLPALPSGWVDQEFFISCSSPQITYKTAVWVRRPSNPRLASGVAVAEPLHSLGIFGVLDNTQRYLVAHGDVHIAVAANSGVVDALVKPANPGRYATLQVPASADAENQILAGVGALLHQAHDPLLPDVAVSDAILGGWSETAIQTRNFISSPDATATINGRRLYDGYYPAQAAVGSMPGPIPDVGVPVVELEGERELLEHVRRFGTIGYRRADSATYRLYEVPGMAHVTSEPDSPLAPFSLGLQCDWPAGASSSTFKQTHIWGMALDNLIRWVSRGVPAPHAPRIAVQADGTTIVRDASGNALGGVRSVVVDVATATIVPTSLNPGGVPGTPCGYVGYQLDFSQPRLVQLYANHGAYVNRVVKDVHRLVGGHWLLPDDARAEIADAVESHVPR